MATAAAPSASDLGCLIRRLAVAVTAALAFTAGPAAAQTYGVGAALELFEGPNYTGRSVLFTADDHNLMNQRFNDAAMSARLVSGQPWEVCVDAEYRGGCVRLERDEPDLRRIGMSRTISSVRRVGWSDGGGWGGPPYGGFGGLTLYSQTNLRGQRFDLSDATPNFSSLGFNDVAQSLVARGRWLVCVDADYRGWCEEVEDEVWDLNAIGLSRRISSARPLDGWGGHDPYPPPYGGGYNQSLRGQTSEFFPAPYFDGRPAPACLSGTVTNACAQRSADAFCRSEGYAGARYFVTDGRGRNAALLDVLCVS